MEFKRLAEVTAAEEAGDAANVLIEEGGEIKRVPKTAVGGAGVSAGVITFANQADGSISCDKTFEEVCELIASGLFDWANMKTVKDNWLYYYQFPVCAFASDGSELDPSDAANAYALNFDWSLFYLSDGTITTEEPTFPDGSSGSPE